MNWLDTSSWSRGEERGTPKEWTLRLGSDLGSERIIVHHHIAHDPEEWICSLHPLGFRRVLKERDQKLAKAEALRIVADYLEGLLAKVRKAER